MIPGAFGKCDAQKSIEWIIFWQKSLARFSKRLMLNIFTFAFLNSNRYLWSTVRQFILILILGNGKFHVCFHELGFDYNNCFSIFFPNVGQAFHNFNFSLLSSYGSKQKAENNGKKQRLNVKVNFINLEKEKAAK